MTEEELNRLEALATHSRDNRYAFAAIEPFNLLSLIRLARVGLAVTPRPIAEVSDTAVLGWCNPPSGSEWRYVEKSRHCITGRDAWMAFDVAQTVSHFIPLSALPKPGGDGISKAHDWRLSDSSLYDFKCRNCGSTDRSKDADLPCTKPGGDA